MSLLLLAFGAVCLFLAILGYIADEVIEPWLFGEERRDAWTRNHGR